MEQRVSKNGAGRGFLENSASVLVPEKSSNDMVCLGIVNKVNP
jgi:hypothetical protein